MALSEPLDQTGVCANDVRQHKDFPMPKTSAAQQKTIGRVMHEFKHGELKSGRGGKGGKVDDPRQAVAIALHEAGASKYESEGENKESLERTKEKEARGETAQQEAEGKSHVGAHGEPESTRAMGGRNAKRVTRKRKGMSGRKASAAARKGMRTRVAKAKTAAARSTSAKKRTKATKGRKSRR
jgi:hypothetical protein